MTSVTTSAAQALIAEPLATREDPVATVRLAMFRRFPFRYLAYLTGIVGGIIFALVTFVKGQWFLSIVGGFVGMYCASRLIRWWLRVHHTKVILTTKRFILQTGLFTKENTELPLPDIHDIRIGDTVITRLLGVGDLVISGGEQKQIVVMGVPRPRDVATLIREPRNAQLLFPPTQRVSLVRTGGEMVQAQS